MSKVNFKALLPGARIDHLCFIVRDLETAMRNYASCFGIRTWYRVKMDKYEMTYRGRPTEVWWDIVMGYSKDVELELISILRADGPTVYDEILGPGGEGFHHVCVSVGNLEEILPAVKRAGMDVIQRGVTHLSGGSVGRYAYIDARKLCGCVLELLEVRLYGIRLPNAEWLLRLGTIIGGVDKAAECRQ